MTSTTPIGRRAVIAAPLLLAACAGDAPAQMAAVSPAFAPPLQTAVQRHGRLSVRGNRIVDAQGEPIVLRGMSLFWAQWMPQFYNAEAIRWLRDDWNVNAVRAAIPPRPGGYVEHPEREMAKAVAVIDAAIANGIYVIVDWHAHQPETDAALRFFDEIARRYGAQPNIIYEPWNEPLPAHGWASHIKPHHERVIAAIRAHDPNNIIVAGTSTWSQDVDEAARDPLTGANIAYTLHFYAGTHREDLRAKAREALRLGAALMVTEYGSTDANGDGPVYVEETEAWWDFLEENQLSYLNWSIADKEESSAALRPGASPAGGWPDSMITQSGLLVRAQLRRMNPR